AVERCQQFRGGQIDDPAETRDKMGVLNFNAIETEVGEDRVAFRRWMARKKAPFRRRILDFFDPAGDAYAHTCKRIVRAIRREKKRDARVAGDVFGVPREL